MMLVLGVGVRGFVQRQIGRDVEQFNTAPLPDKLTGVALERQAFRDPHMLPVYGSSELTEDQTNRADVFFAAHPTGFGAFLIGNPGETSLIIATKLAAAGDVAVGRRAVVFLSPGWFLVPALDPKGFGVNFSFLHGGIFAFESRLSAGLKQAISRRLLDYPVTLARDTVLREACANLAQNSAPARVRLASLVPLGVLGSGVQWEMDYAQLGLWWWQRNRPTAPAPGAPRGGPIDWRSRLQATDTVYAAQRVATAYSTGPRTWFDDARGRLFHDPSQALLSPDEQFEKACRNAREWEDLRLLVRTAGEMRVRLLIVCQPINTNFNRQHGLTSRSTAFFYRRLAAALEGNGDIELRTWPDEGLDAHFYRDCVHPSAKAWLIYDQALDAFYHQGADSEAQSQPPVGQRTPPAPAGRLIRVS
jgi:D-alanine transfer protein